MERAEEKETDVYTHMRLGKTQAVARSAEETNALSGGRMAAANQLAAAAVLRLG